jgi:hypothetical protein
MSGKIYVEAPPLTDAEMRQLKELLVRYAMYQAAGLANFAIEAVIGQIRGHSFTIEATPANAPQASKRKPLPRHSSQPKQQA